ncbi:FixH family protein [Chelatococcus reniformis]|uniref:YtkA-like domain-containing protein n=1 Tax=Chelatococcus reniformis TaxID=1494448 RepID=A0A916UDZ1_9HYPH|nr:FixH family protein [Chelatococcus reniformis]GGC68867.1 hypothetical protein GCM10010994_29290 [Chelatococcus reniformis]
MTNTIKRAALAALTSLALAGTAWAGINDYEFKLVKDEVRQGEATLDVRLVDKRTGQPVPDAVIFAKRIDMAPDDMETMTSRIEQLPSPEPGIYRFKAKLTMAGGWRLSLGAKIQGETGTLENKLVLKATK